VLKSGAIYFFGRFGASAITLLSVAVYTRLLSPAEYGVYALVLSGALMVYAGAMQWLTFALARFLPAYQGQEEVVLSHVATAYAASALLFFGLTAALVPWLAPAAETRTLIVLGVVIFVTMSLAELNLVTFQMRGMAYRYVKFALLRVLAAATIGVMLAYLGWGSIGLLLGVIVGHLCISLPNLASTWGSIRRALLRKQLYLELAAYGFPFAMTGALAAVINASDRYIIGILIGTEAAGLYAAPYDLAMRSLHVLMMVVAMAGNPIIFRAFEADGECTARPIMRRQAELLLGLALPAAIGFALLAPVIAQICLGDAFHATARQLMPWIAAATVLSGFQSFYLALAFSLPKQPFRQTLIFVVGAMVNVGLNFVLIPRLGVLGAALATIIAYVLILLGSLVVGRRLFALPLPTSGLVKVLAACAVWALILWPVHDTTALLPVVLHVLIGGIVYLAIFCGLDVGHTRRAAVRGFQLASDLMFPRRFGLKR
jgi:O-antigen/teichoic acid export membrane protein